MHINFTPKISKLTKDATEYLIFEISRLSSRASCAVGLGSIANHQVENMRIVFSTITGLTLHPPLFCKKFCVI